MRVKGVSLHQFPSISSQPARQKQWLAELRLEEQQILDHHHVCSLRCHQPLSKDASDKEKQSVWFKSTDENAPVTVSTVTFRDNTWDKATQCSCWWYQSCCCCVWLYCSAYWYYCSCSLHQHYCHLFWSRFCSWWNSIAKYGMMTDWCC